MKITELKTNDGGRENPCELVAKYLMHELDGGTLISFMQTFDFDTRKEIEVAIRLFFRTVHADLYMQQKHLEERDPLASAVYERCRRIFCDQSKFDKYPIVTSGEIWHGGFSRQRLEARTSALFSTEPDEKVFTKACKDIKRIYQLSDIDIEKIHFFVEQVKAGSRFPDSLRRMLYIWGVEKMTGKTTSATMLVSLLNGDEDEQNISRYSTTLSNEMQIKNFSVPKISECNVCLMDECFYADMGKTYADFKRFITSSNGRSRLPFGQEFEWTGYPNYISTSNEPLRMFIKDWGDRRYLSVEFKDKPTEKLGFADIKALWKRFVVNSTKTKTWSDWANEIAPVSEEEGERSVISNEFIVELKKSENLYKIINMPTPLSRYCSDSQITTKYFVDMFSATIGSVEAHKRRKEIEAAVVSVYGQKYSTTNYWILEDLKNIAQTLLFEMDKHNESGDYLDTSEVKILDAAEKLPF